MGQQRLQQKDRADRAAVGDDAAAAVQQQDAAHDGAHQHDARHMGLQHQQKHHRHQRQQGDGQLPNELLVQPPARSQMGAALPRDGAAGAAGQVGGEQDHFKLDQLRHLQGGQAADVQPAAAAVERLAEQHRHQQHQADEVARPHELADEPQVKIRKQEHHPYPDQGVKGLRLDVVKAVPHAEIAGGIAGATLR